MGSFVDRGGNHIEMGLHVFFGCYSNLFRLMKKVHVYYMILVACRSATCLREEIKHGINFRLVPVTIYWSRIILILLSTKEVILEVCVNSVETCFKLYRGPVCNQP